jgi:hypothetical protein
MLTKEENMAKNEDITKTAGYKEAMEPGPSDKSNFRVTLE